MYGVLLGFHILISLALISIVLVQSGKGGGLAGGAFGGGAQTVFGGRGANDVITRATIVLAGLFFLTSLVLALMTAGLGRTQKSLMQEQAKQATTAPAPGQAPSALPEQPPAPAQPPAGQGSGGAGGP
jgi:preprotein translocase subunit SecG